MPEAMMLPQRYEADVDVERLRPHPLNAKLHDLASIGASIEGLGFGGAIYAQESTGYILSGHGTLEAAVQKGMTTVPVIWIDCDDDTAEGLLVAYNAIQENAGYDPEAMERLLSGVAERGQLELVGFTADKMDDFLLGLGVEYHTEEEEFTGGYADDADERRGEMPRGPQPQRGLRERVLVLAVDDMQRLEEIVGEFRKDHAECDTFNKGLLGVVVAYQEDQHAEVRGEQEPAS